MLSAVSRRSQRGARIVMSFFAVLVALVGSVSACVANAGAAPVRLMPLGDSITDGYNIPGGYRIELENALVADGYEFDFVGSRANGPQSLADKDHEGHSGLRIDELDALIDGSLARHEPELVLLMIGTNDVLQGYGLAQAPQRVSALIERISARAPSATILVSSLTPLAAAAHDERVRAYNAAIPRIVEDKAAHGKRIRFVDMYPALTSADLADGVHPNATGYRKMASVWHAAVQDVRTVVGPPQIAPVPQAGPPAPPAPVVAAPAPTMQQPPVPAPRRLVSIAKGQLRADRRGRVRVRLSCHPTAPSGCSGVVRLRRAAEHGDGSRLARTRFRIPPAQTASVTLRLGRHEARKLRRRVSTRVSVEAVVRNDSRRYTTRASRRLRAR